MNSPNAPGHQSSTPRLPAVPSWVFNLGGFGILIGLVLIAFTYQLKAVNTNLRQNALTRSMMVATIIEQHLANAALANETIDSIMSSLLRDKARFVNYLDTIEPLHEDELEALARESGLAGISLMRHSGLTVSGPRNWLGSEITCTAGDETLRYNEAQRLGYLTLADQNEQSDVVCLVLGLDASHIIALHRQTSLPVLLAALSSLPGIHLVRLEDETELSSTLPADVRIIQEQERVFAETRMTSSRGTLVVRLDADNYTRNRDQLRNQFIFMASLLFLLGIFFSWLLYRYQKSDLARTRHFERVMAREHEAAALGRTTATIAHEVRNPLNAINMGLQRLTIESDNLDKEQLALIAAMQEAVMRTSATVRALQRFTRPLKPQASVLFFDHLIEQALTLCRQSCDEQGLRITTDLTPSISLQGDKDLLAELVENCLKNALEAQPDGGFLSISLAADDTSLCLTMVNGGCTLNEEEISRLGEPYFTTKTRGSGLGLALCRRIAEAHAGAMEFLADPLRQTFTIEVCLPRTLLREETLS